MKMSCVRRVIFGLAAAAALLAPPNALQAAESTRMEIPRRSVEPITCPIEIAPALAGRVRCGQLRVPEDRSLPDGRTITTTFAIIDAAQPLPNREPILFIMGGNGSGLRALQRQSAVAQKLSQHDTVIFVDHRGSAPWTQPFMGCTQFPEGLDAAAPNVDPAQFAACRDHLRQVLDVNLYGPYEAAQDLRDLRLALDVPRWNVYSVSYGTTIGQRLIGVDGGAIHRIVFDGMSGADAMGFADDFQLDPLIELLDACASDGICSAAFPRLEQQLAQVVARLERRPLQIAGKTVSNIEYGGQIRSALGDTARRAAIPLAIDRSAHGDFSAWSRLAPDAEVLGRGEDPAFTWPSSVCREEYLRREDVDMQHPAKRALGMRIARAMHTDYEQDWAAFCAGFGFRRSAPDRVAIVMSDIPALMLVGEIDTITPKTWSDHAAQSLRDSRTVVFPLTSHWVLRRHVACAGDLVLNFFADPRAAPDMSCVEALPRLRWQTK
jgi:pimeloyl-ACP methyl ester carboxylesterase